MTYSIACGDVMTGCPTQLAADSEEKLTTKVAEHAEAGHGAAAADLPPETMAQLKAAVHQS